MMNNADEDASCSSSVSSLGHVSHLDPILDHVKETPAFRRDEQSERTINSHKDTADNGDDIAKMMTDMVAGKSILSLGVSLAQRAAVVESINWLARHVPRCVLSQICRETLWLNSSSTNQTRDTDVIRPRRRGSIVNIPARDTERSLQNPMELPNVKRYEAALLFIDISGFTKLAQLLDVESLSKVRIIIKKQIRLFFHPANIQH